MSDNTRQRKSVKQSGGIQHRRPNGQGKSYGAEDNGEQNEFTLGAANIWQDIFNWADRIVADFAQQALAVNKKGVKNAQQTPS